MEHSEADREKILRYLKGDYTREDHDYFSEIIRNNSKKKELKKILADHWDELFSDIFQEDCNLDHILCRIHNEIDPVVKHSGWIDNFFKWSVRISAVIFLPAIFFLLFQVSRNAMQKDEMASFFEFNSPAWTRTQFILPDGTKGWLNSNSSLSYSSDIVRDRQVFLTGEALFEVNSDDNPFLVKTEEATLTVTGTRFNVTSYDNEDYIEVVLDDGNLLFSGNKNNIQFNMSPSDKVVYSKKLGDISHDRVDPIKYTAWTEGMLVFRNDPVDVVARRLERWYNIDIELQGNLSDDMKLRATFIDESLEEVLDLLKKSLNIDYRITGRDLGSGDMYTRWKVFITI